MILLLAWVYQLHQISLINYRFFSFIDKTIFLFIIIDTKGPYWILGGFIMKIGLFYGTTSAATQEVADLIQDQMSDCEIEVFDVYEQDLNKMSDFDRIIIGCPTWDIGLLQEDWRSKFDELDSIDFSGKKVAYYGCGDQNIYSSSFLDALGILEEKITSKGGITIGQTSTDGYEYDFSKAEKDGQFVGLGIDNDNEPELTEERVEAWCKTITEQFK